MTSARISVAILAVLCALLAGCGTDLRGQRDQAAALAQADMRAGEPAVSPAVRFAALEEPGGSASDAVAQHINKAFQDARSADRRPSLHLTVTKNSPVRSLLEMRHHDVIIQSWDLSCGAAALATLLRYEWGDPVTEKQVAQGLMGRREYIEHPNLVQLREGFSLLDLKRYVQAHGFKGEGFGGLDFDDLVEKAPIMVPVDALGYNHFVIFRGAMGDRVLLADPAWGNRTMTIAKFKRMWLDYGKRMGHVGFVVERPGVAPISKMSPTPNEFVTFN
jgi:predicted double-glycine peptidase